MQKLNPTTPRFLFQMLRDDPTVKVDAEFAISYKFASVIYYGSYIGIRIKGKMELLHRYIMEFPIEKVDHKNRLNYDNRKENLRLGTQAFNLANKEAYSNNKSGYKGVAISPNGKYRAHVGYKGKQLNVGTYKTKEEAALAYNKKALELYGEFAYQNIIPTEETKL